MYYYSVACQYVMMTYNIAQTHIENLKLHDCNSMLINIYLPNINAPINILLL